MIIKVIIIMKMKINLNPGVRICDLTVAWTS